MGKFTIFRIIMQIRAFFDLCPSFAYTLDNTEQNAPRAVANNIRRRKRTPEEYPEKCDISKSHERDKIEILPDLDAQREQEYEDRHTTPSVGHEDTHKTAYQHRYEDIAAVRSDEIIMHKHRDEQLGDENNEKCRKIHES